MTCRRPPSSPTRWRGSFSTAPRGHAREAALDDLDGIGRAEQLLDVGFAKVERHWAG